MGKGPGLFGDIGKKAKDILYKDYNYDHKFAVTTTTSTGLSFQTTVLKKGEAVLGDVNTTFKNKNLTADIKVDTKSNIHTTLTIDEFAQGAKSIVSFTIPDQKSGKVELQYAHDYAGVSTSVGLTSSPILDIHGAIGSEGFSLGGELGFDTASATLTKYSAGLGFTKPDFSAALVLVDKGDTIKASYLHNVSPATRTTVAVEIAHKLSKREVNFTVGGLYELDALTTAKARVTNSGKLAGLLQHEFRPKSLVTISGEVDTKALDRNAKIGLALALKP
eukprot:TRINITY_DN21641_c0_g1_i1.p1 TRINITY_DN21641_c0_g1~~TRINITY_DN21641_c0_g1_i1.p1  ORF type:complete len:277 (-),score=57.46 TRINITY_DN21641_c0_g1_i1:325-1155(-)